MTTKDFRKYFPVLDRKVYGRPLVYFDNAATAQRPQPVIDEWNLRTSYSNANIHRAVHKLAQECTDAYEEARDAVKELINAPSREEVVVTSGATAAINLVAYSFGEAFIKEGDEIIVTEGEHHSNIVPWWQLCQRKKAVLKVFHVDDKGHLRLDQLDELITDRTKLLALAQVSNVLGIVNPVKEIVRRAHEKGVPVLVDGAQGIVHCKTDVQDLDCDFYAFSGHKMYAATGTGVLYGKRSWLEAMPPFMGGGEMIESVSFEDVKFAKIPMKYEAGTQNFASSATLKQACEFVKLLKDKELTTEFEQNSLYMEKTLKNVEGLKIYGEGSAEEPKVPVFSFTVEGAHHEDLAILLDKMGVAVRSGQMCAEPVMTRFGVTGMVRVSLLPYNTKEEIDIFADALDKAVGMLR